MVVVSVPVKLGSNGVFKPEIFVSLKTSYIWRYSTRFPLFNQLITCLFMILAYSLPQPPRHS